MPSPRKFFARSGLVVGLALAIALVLGAPASAAVLTTAQGPTVLANPFFDFSNLMAWGTLQFYKVMLSILGWVLNQVLERSDPDFTNQAFANQLGLMRTIGLYLIVPFSIVAILMGVLKGQLREVLGTFALAIPAAIIGTPVSVYGVRMLQVIDKQLCDAIISFTDTQATTFLTALTSLHAPLVSSPQGAVVAFLLSLVMIVFLIFVAIELLLRESMMLLVMLFLPLAFAFACWKPTRSWLPGMIETLVVLVFLRFLIVATMMFGFGIMSSVAEQPLGGLGDTASQAIGTLTVGVLVVIIASFGAPVLLTFVIGANVVGRTNTKDVISQTPLSLSTGRNAARDQAVAGIGKAVGTVAKLAK